MKQRSVYRAMLIYLCILALTIQPCSAKLYNLIAQENLKSLAALSSEQTSVNPNQEYYQLYRDELKRQLNPSIGAKRRFAFNLAQSHDTSSTSDLILDVTSWQDLELLSGPKSDPTQYLGAQLDRTNTEIGKLCFFKKLVDVCPCVPKLLQQQEFIKTIVEEANLYDSVISQFKQLNADENVLFSLWDDELFYSILLHDFNILPFAETLNAQLATVPAFNQYMETSSYSADVAMMTTAGVGFVTLTLYALAVSQGSNYAGILHTINKWLGIDSLGRSNPGGMLLHLSSRINPHPFSQAFSKWAILFFSGWSALNWIQYSKNNIKSRMVFSHCLQTKLMHIAHYLSTIENILHTFEFHPCCRDFEAIQHLKQEFNSLIYSSDELAQFLKLLLTDTFKDLASFFSYQGRVYAAYKLLHMHKKKFVNVMMALGEIDAHISIAKLYKEFQDKEHTFCFAEYIQESEPSLYLEEFWNPMIKADQIVTNNYAAGKLFHEKQHMIISGPNAGGKSTAMKSIILNIILPLGLGISPSRKCIVPPFTKIMTYLNITDDLIARKSRYKAGLLRARELIETVKKEDGKGFTFTSVDEAFDGTNFKISQAAAYALIKRLSSYPHNMCVACSHFPMIPTLEKASSNIANYKVSVNDNQGPINYPFKLEKGISHQTVAVKMLEQEGFDAEFMSILQDILNKT